MAAPLVSLITPAYNQARWLPETIESVLAQTHPAIDYLVVDDGSSDPTPEVLARYAGRVASRRQANQGQVRTLNTFWDAAPGQYLAYLSSDDTLAPTAIARAVERLEADPSLVAVFPQADLIDENSRLLKRRVCRPFDLADLVIHQECWIGPGAVFRVSAYRAAGPWNPALRLAPDREFWMRMAHLGGIAMIDEPLAGYRLHAASISSSELSEERAREYLAVLNLYFARPDVPEAIRARRDEAYGRANLVIARIRARAGDWSRFRHYWREAVRLHPPLAGLSTQAMLARAVVGKRVRLVQARLKAALG
ncbi:MAG: glycosyltransferase [Sphingomonadaceae bacterium]